MFISAYNVFDDQKAEQSLRELATDHQNDRQLLFARIRSLQIIHERLPLTISVCSPYKRTS
jgi:hypothetical protein